MDTSKSKPPPIEPGLVQIFRLFSIFQWVILGLGFCGLRNSPDVGAPVLITLMLVHTTILVLYLMSKILLRWFKRIYLPIALFFATFTPIIVTALAVATRIQSGLRGEASAGQEGALLLWLFTPLMAIAAQYGFVSVIVFCVVTTGLELFFAAGLANEGSIGVGIVWEQAFIRNLVFLAIGYIISRLISEQRRQRKSLQEANQQLAQFAVTLEQLGISRERNRMARDLHDTLAHTLSAVAIQLEAVTTIWDTSPDLARQRIEKIQQVTRDGLQETRKALQALRSSPLDDLGLVMALQSAAEKASERAGFRLHTDLPPTLPELAPELEINLYRIIEEAFNNIVKHAEATEVWLAFEQHKTHIEFRVRDNGIGFDTNVETPQGHYGLVGMQERAALYGAVISIESAPEIGTQIKLQVEI